MVGLDRLKSIWLVANWKSNKNIAEALEWVSRVGPKIPNQGVKVVVCAPFTDLAAIKKEVVASGFNLMVGCEDISPFGEGAYTGEEAGRILKEVVDLAIIGHSERRREFGETDEMVVEKVLQARENNIIPLVCVQGPEVAVPEGVELVAFEPVFAIGTGNPDTPADAESVAAKLRTKYGEGLEVLYGGSVDKSNASAFVKQENIFGLLVGSASLEAEDFVAILDSVGV